MANYDPYDRDYSRGTRYARDDRRDDRDHRYVDTRDSRDYGRSHSGDVVPHGRAADSQLSVHEIQRDFPPPTGRQIGRARSADPGYYDDDGYYDDYHRGYAPRSRHGGSVYHEEHERKKKPTISKEERIIAAVAGAALLAGGKELYDRREAKEGRSDVQRNALTTAALAGVGALAAYQGAEYYNKVQAKKDRKATYILHHGRDGQIAEYYSEDEDDRERKGHKSFLESAIAATGLGAAVKSFAGGDSHRDDRSDGRSRRGSRSRSSSRSREGGANKMQKAAMASLLAGATEAFRVSKEPGGWKGEKAKRVLTAAAGAAAVDGAHGDSHGKLGLVESVIGGLVGNRLINGPKGDIEEDEKTGRSRSRSRARSSKSGGKSSGSGLAALASAGLGAVGAKKAYDSYHSRSRSRSRARSESRGGSDRNRRSRSRSVVDKARNSLAKLGIGSGAGAGAADSHRRNQDDYDDRGHRSRRYSDDEYDDDYRSKGGRNDRHRDRKGSRSGSETDLGDSEDDEKAHRKMRGKQFLTSGLAAVATIHAAHGVYSSMEKANARRKAVREGKIKPEEARKLKSKAMMQNAASVGIAAMGVKGAFDEMKEAREKTHECNEFKQQKVWRHQRREERRKRNHQPDGRQRADSESTPYRNRYDDYDDHCYLQPRYYDGNPYGTLPYPVPPEIGQTWGY